MATHKARIETLDGFRCIAILMVVLYHYYSKWTPPLSPQNYYPYGNALYSYFQYGYLGVHFFFIISGFVIFYTLEKSATPGSFFFKRLIRLFPPMLVCAAITYFVTKVLDPANNFSPLHSPTALNFLPSLTFTHPIIWIKLLHNNTIYYIDGAYWSLWVEITFYIISGSIFFYNRGRFIRNWTILLILALILKLITLPQSITALSAYPALYKIANGLSLFAGYLNIFNFIIYFTLGILFYCLFFRKKITGFFLVSCIIFTVAEIWFYPGNGVRLAFLLMITLFLLFIYKPQYLSFLKNRFIARIGVTSYTIYLIHQNVGVLLINKLSVYTQSPVLLKMIPVVVIVTAIAFAELLYRLYEKPVMKKLTALLVKQPAKIN